MRKSRPETNPKFVSVDRIATELDVATRTIRRAIDRKELPVVRIGRAVRVARVDLEAWLRRNRS